MKLETQSRDDHQVQIIAEFESSVLEEYRRRAARKISRETRIPGFRPGKAPMDLVRRSIGEEALTQQAIEDLVDEMYPKILDEAKVEPGAAGSLDEIISVDPPKLSFLIPLAPVVELGNYRDLRQDYTLEPVAESDVDEFLKRMQTSYATAEPVEKPAEKGDLVYVMFSGELTQPAEGENSAVFPERPAQFIVGDDVMQDRNWPFPGFNDSLAGMQADEEKEILHTFAEDHDDEALRGKEVSFKVKVQSVKALHLPELNDEFATMVGQFENIDGLRAAVREQLESARKQETDDKYFLELTDKIIAQSTIKYPPQVLNHEAEHLLEHLKEDLSRQGLEMDAYFKMMDTTREKYIEETVKPAAAKRLERSLVMEELGKIEKVELDKKAYDEAITESIQQLSSIPRPKKAKEQVNKEVVNNITMNALSRKYNQLILERLKAIATGTADKVEPETQETNPEAEATAPETDKPEVE